MSSVTLLARSFVGLFEGVHTSVCPSVDTPICLNDYVSVSNYQCSHSSFGWNIHRFTRHTRSPFLFFTRLSFSLLFPLPLLLLTPPNSSMPSSFLLLLLPPLSLPPTFFSSSSSCPWCLASVTKGHSWGQLAILLYRGRLRPITRSEDHHITR